MTDVHKGGGAAAAVVACLSCWRKGCSMVEGDRLVEIYLTDNDVHVFPFIGYPYIRLTYCKLKYMLQSIFNKQTIKKILGN